MSNQTRHLLSGEANHRSLTLLTGDWAWRLSQLAQHLQAFNLQQGCWVGDSGQLGIPSANTKQLQNQLGQTLDFAVFCAESGIAPNDLALATGMIKAGGTCFILLPQNWLSFANPACQNWLNYPYTLEQAQKGFNAHLWQHLAHLANTPDLTNTTSPPTLKPTAVPLLPALQTPTHDQVALTQALPHVLFGHSKRPLVITAGRGRGKSYGLGLGCAKFFQMAQQSKSGTGTGTGKPNYHLAITASQLAQSQEVFAGFWQSLSDTQQKSAIKQPGLVDLGNFQLKYYAPDALLENTQPIDLLLIDEAAQLPVPLLIKLVSRYHRTALATTTQGYEGAGRGFGHQFYRWLDAHTPNWTHLKLHTPIRWAENDPLEHWIANLLWLPNEAEAPEPSQRLPNQVVPNLLNNESALTWQFAKPLALPANRLQQAFQLLLSAHYQTTPNELMQLMEAPNLYLQLAIFNQEVVGVALAIAEGTLPIALYQTTERRLQGHLIPQLLYKQTADNQWLSLQGWRIQRIAIQSAWQNKTLGTQLLAQLHQQAKAQALDYVATSFGATEPLLRFWHKAGYTPLHLGLKRDKASASHSITMLHPLSPNAHSLCQTTQHKWQWQFASLLQQEFSQLPLDLTLCLIRLCQFEKAPFPSAMLSAIRPPFEAFSWPLWHWLLGKLSQTNYHPSTATEQALCHKLLQHHSWPQLQQSLQVSKKQLLAHLLEMGQNELPPQ